MQAETVFTATKARQHFFDLLRLAGEGKKPIVINKHTGVRIKLTLVKQKNKKRNIDKILKEMSKIGLKITPIRKMKKIFESRYDSSLFGH